MYNFIFRNIMHKLPKTHHFPPFTAQWFSTRFFSPVPGTISIHGSFNQKTIWTTGSSVYFLDLTIVQQIEKSKQLNKFFFLFGVHWGMHQVLFHIHPWITGLHYVISGFTHTSSGHGSTPHYMYRIEVEVPACVIISSSFFFGWSEKKFIKYYIVVLSNKMKALSRLSNNQIHN